MKTEPVTDHELQRAKNQFARDYILGRETNQDKAAQLAHAAVIHNDITTADGEFDIFQSITDRRRPARGQDLFHADQPSRDRTSCRKGGDSSERRRARVDVALGAALLGLPCAGGRRRARASAELAERDAAAAAAGARGQLSAVRDQDARERAAGRGRAAPRAAGGHACGCWCAPARAQDPPASRAWPRWRPRCSTRAPATRSAAQIADAIDTIGGVLGTGAGTDLSFANVLVMKDGLGFGFDLLADVVRRPGVSPARSSIASGSRRCRGCR